MISENQPNQSATLATPTATTQSAPPLESAQFTAPRNNWLKIIFHRIGSSWLLSSLTGAALLFGAFTVFAYGYFGSMGVALAYIRGERLIADPEVVTVSMSDRELVIPIRLHNFTSSAVNIVGATSKCGCGYDVNLPMKLEPGNHRSMQIICSKSCFGGCRMKTVLEFHTDYIQRKTIPIYLRFSGSDGVSCAID